MMLYTDREGNLKGLPKFPPNKQVEAVFMVVDHSAQKQGPRRRPNPDIAGKIQITGNVFDTASADDWKTR